MALLLDGSGSITGLSAGGLPDSSITAADIADGAITSAKLDTTTSQLFGMRNRIINGDMRIWQRGTSFTTTGGGYNYTADRFAVYCAGANATWSQNTSVPSGFQYSLKMQRTSGQTYTNLLYAFQVIETNNCIDLAGQSITLSFWAKAGANFSAASSQMNVYLNTGTGTDQGLSSMGGGTWTGATSSNLGNPTITTTWTKYSYTTTLGASVSEIGIQLQYTPVGTAGADDSLYITGVQLEIGSTATPFERRLYGQELALCQRYYETSGASAAWSGVTVSGSIYYAQNKFQVAKRTSSPSISNTNAGNTGFSTTASIANNMDNYGFLNYRTSNGAANGGYFQDTWKATDEL